MILMDKKPVVVIGRSRRPETLAQDFVFTDASLPISGPLQDYRHGAWETFKRLPIPTVKDEAWRRTDLVGMPVANFHLPSEKRDLDLKSLPEGLLNPLGDASNGGRVILHTGGAKIDLSDSLKRAGVIFTDFGTAEREHPELLKRLAGSLVHAGDGKFAALAAAMAQKGVLVYIPKGLNLEQPLLSLFWAPGSELAHFSHILVWVDDGASLTYLHETASPANDGPSLHTGIMEILVGNGASLKFVELQSWGNQVWNFNHQKAQVQQDGRLEWIFGLVGSRLTKSFSGVDLVGEGSTSLLSGFYFTDGHQHFDLSTRQDHLAPNTTSDLLYKGALKGQSRSIWRGMVYVAKGAQKANGYQVNRNLVLSKGSHADSIPGLEILADDVRCSHGATVGKLEQEPLFYLKSRGLPDKDAEHLLVEGFFDPIMQRIPFESIRDRFQQAIEQKMNS